MPLSEKPYGRMDLLRDVKACVMIPGSPRGQGECLFFGYALYIRAARGIVIKVEADSNNHADHYYGVRMTVVGREKKLDSVMIFFDQLLESKPDPRSSVLHIWHSSDGEDWYIRRPESMVPLMVAINDYVLFWRKHVA